MNSSGFSAIPSTQRQTYSPLTPSESSISEEEPIDFKTNPDIDPALWEHYYEAAIATRNPEVRLQRIAEAQALILRRAEALEEGKATDSECQALEDAAEFLQGLKAASIGNGVGKQVEVGDFELLPNKTGKPDDPILKSQRLT